MLKNEEYWMQKAIDQAKLGKTPFGAVIVNENDECVVAFNTTKKDGPTAHAEMNAIKKFHQLSYTNAKKLRLYTTVEPCPMCMSAIVWAGIGKVIYGASIYDAAQVGKQINIRCEEVAEKSWYAIEILAGIKKEDCIVLLKS